MEIDCSLQSACAWLCASYTGVKTSAIHHHTVKTKDERTVKKECWLSTILSVGMKDNHLQQETELHGVSFLQTGG